MNKWKYIWLFLSGLFFGGAIDHVVFAVLKTQAPYGIYLGVKGNWIMASVDLVIAILLFLLFRKK